MALNIRSTIRLVLVHAGRVASYSSVKNADPGIAGLGKASTKKKGKFSGATGKMLFDVETDAKTLVSYVCGSNILKEGGEDIPIKPDSEYPDWLWTIRNGRAPTLDELDPNTLEYWKKVRKLGRRRVNYLKSVKPF